MIGGPVQSSVSVTVNGRFAAVSKVQSRAIPARGNEASRNAAGLLGREKGSINYDYAQEHVYGPVRITSRRLLETAQHRRSGGCSNHGHRLGRSACRHLQT